MNTGVDLMQRERAHRHCSDRGCSIVSGLCAARFAGVAACYRGYRLYDDDVTKALVQKWVRFYKAHRDILTSDIVHVRRPDMQVSATRSQRPKWHVMSRQRHS